LTYKYGKAFGTAAGFVAVVVLPKELRDSFGQLSDKSQSAWKVEALEFIVSWYL
jgi:hypothetical protein